MKAKVIGENVKNILVLRIGKYFINIGKVIKTYTSTEDMINDIGKQK